MDIASARLNKWSGYYESVIVFILTALIIYPAVKSVHTNIIGDGVDTIEYYSYFSAVKYNITHKLPPLWKTQIYRYPVGVNTSLSDGRLFVLLGGLLSFVLPSVLSYNLLLISFFVLNGFVSYLFYKSLSGSIFLGFLGGIINGFSYWVIMNGYGAINVFLMFGLPLLGLVIQSVIRHGLNLNNIFRIFVGLYILSLCSAEIFLFNFILFL